MVNYIKVRDLKLEEIDDSNDGFIRIPFSVSDLQNGVILDIVTDYVINLLKERYDNIVILSMGDGISSITTASDQIEDIVNNITNFYLSDQNTFILNLIPLDIYSSHSGSNEANMFLELFGGNGFRDLSGLGYYFMKYAMLYLNDYGAIALGNFKKFES